VLECLKGKEHNTLFSNNINTIKKKSYNYIFKPYCEKVYIGYNNNHFKVKDFGIYILHKSIFDINFLTNPKLWNLDEIEQINHLYSEKVLKNNIERITKVLESINLTEPNKIGIIQASGTSIAYDWLIKEFINPIYLIYNKSILKEDEKEIENHKNMRLLIPLFEKVYKQKTI
jgi:hypothetical protein